GVINAALMYDPTLPIKDKDGNFVQSNNLLLNNPVSLIKGISNKIKTNRTIGSLTMNYKITNGLSTKIRFGSSRRNSRRNVYNSTKTLLGSASGGIGYIATRDLSHILGNYTLNYDKTINENNSLTFLAGVSYEDFTREFSFSSTSNFPSDKLGTHNLGFGSPSNASVGSNKLRHSLL